MTEALLKGKEGWAFWHVLEGTLQHQDPHAWTAGVTRPETVDDTQQAMDKLSAEFIKEDHRQSAAGIFPQLAGSISTHTAVIKDELSLQAWLFINSPYRYHWYCAGIGTGKSYVLARWMFMRLVTNPETVGLVAANTYTQLIQSTLPHLFELLDESGLEYVSNCKPPKSWKASNKFKGGYKHIISIKVGVGKVAHLLTRTLAAWKRMRGITIGWAGIDEIADTVVDAWKEINERLRCKKSHHLQIRVVGMPSLPGDNWTWEVFNPEDPKAQAMFRITFQSSTEARHLKWKDYILPLLRTLDPLQAMQRVFARIVIDQSGRAYRSYKDGINNVKKYGYDPWRPLYLTSDFNILSSSALEGCALQLFENGQGDWDVQVLDEFVLPNGDTSDLCYTFLERECDDHKFGDHKGELHFYGDASGGHGQTVSEYKVAVDILGRTFRGRLNVPPITVNPNITDRVATVNALLRPTYGPPRLYMHPKKCIRLITDMRKVMPDPKHEGKLDKSDKALTHVSDALGYLLRWLFPPWEETQARGSINAEV